METQNSYHHEDLKTELLESGIKMVSEEGEKSFSLRKLAAKCNVSHQAPYNHFSTKEKFIEAIQEYITLKFTNELKKTLEQCPTNEDPIEKLGESYFNFFVSNPNYFTFLFGQANLHLDLTQNADSQKNYQPYEIFKSLLKQILDQNNVSPEKQNDIIIALWAYIHGLTALATLKNVKYDKNWQLKLKDFLMIFDCKELRRN